ncbi:hypothetical protein T10_8137 [Trichinella papuae]|uniref:Retrovirus-related Pol polyprotein from transposon n=1 Tax=Trichinella papuae TaxID=268474 RepID=A0A0V1M7P3_9BILA|nr:hypothetical protein T10_8137 [Trichinella papuae]
MKTNCCKREPTKIGVQKKVPHPETHKSQRQMIERLPGQTVHCTEVNRTSEHAEGCRVDAHAFYHQQQLNELKRLAAEDPRPVTQIYHELASSASTSLNTAGNFPTWDQARHIMYYSRARRFPPLPETRQELQPTAEQRAANSGEQV